MSKLAVFDCDGTLVDSQADIFWAMTQAFERAEQPLPDAGMVRRIVGLSLPVAILKLAPDLREEDRNAIAILYKSAFRKRREKGQLLEPLFDGIGKLLHDLTANGWKLAVATGKSSRGLDAVLDHHGLTDLFVSLQTADHHPSKPHPAMLEAALLELGIAADNAVMIGDTSFDMEMARSAQVRAIGVAWGYHEAEDLNASGADIIARDVAHLGEILEATA